MDRVGQSTIQAQTSGSVYTHQLYDVRAAVGAAGSKVEEGNIGICAISVCNRMTNGGHARIARIPDSSFELCGGPARDKTSLTSNIRPGATNVCRRPNSSR